MGYFVNALCQIKSYGQLKHPWSFRRN